MIKRIVLGTTAALVMIGCGGGTNSAGTAYVYGVNADPNQGSLSILANGTTVLNNGAYATTSSTFTTVSGGTNAIVYCTNSSGTSLAQTTLASGFLNQNYYAIYAYGGNLSQSLAILPVDVSSPPAGSCRILFTNTSVVQPSVDVYVTTQASPSGLTPNKTSISAFTSGFSSEVNNIAPGTYNVFFTQAGNQTIVASQANVSVGTTASGVGANEIAMVGITDAPGAGAPILLQTIAPIMISVVTGANPPAIGVRPVIANGTKLKS